VEIITDVRKAPEDARPRLRPRPWASNLMLRGGWDFKAVIFKVK